MKESQLLRSVLKKLKDNKIAVRRRSTTEDNKLLIFTDTVVIVLDDSRKVILSFDVDVRPDFSAFLSVELLKIRGIKDVQIGELFMQDAKNKTILTGDEAVKQFMKVSRQTAISDFIKEQLTEHMLRSDRKIPSC